MRVFFKIIVFFLIFLTISPNQFKLSNKTKIICRKDADKTISIEEFKKCLSRFLQDESVKLNFYSKMNKKLKIIEKRR